MHCKVITRLDRPNQNLTLVCITEDGYQGILILPTDPFSKWAHELVTSPTGEEIHTATFEIQNLGDSEADLGPYIVGMTNSARRGFRRVS
jgi:hypothetical protein